jgi:pyruvate kinase
MLSGETASGRYPLAAVEMMDRIVREAEAAGAHARRVEALSHPAPIALVVAEAACEAARAAGAVAVCCFTLRGETARLLAHFRPRVPIIAYSPDQAARRRLALYWGVVPRVLEPVKSSDVMTEIVTEKLLEDGVVRPGDRIVLVHGLPAGVPGQTNSIRVHQIPHPSELRPGSRYRVPI